MCVFQITYFTSIFHFTKIQIQFFNSKIYLKRCYLFSDYQQMFYLKQRTVCWSLKQKNNNKINIYLTYL